MTLLPEAERAEAATAPGRGAENPSGVLGSLVADYDGLRRVARGLLRRRARDVLSLGPTDLVNEAVVRLLMSPNVRGQADRRYVFAAAMQAMRRVLVEPARAGRRVKRGGAWARLPLDAVLDYFEEQNVDAVDLDEAIERLAAWAGRQAEAVTMRYFLQMKVTEIADHLGVSVSTVEGDLTFARAWLRRELAGCEGPRPDPDPGGLPSP